MSFSSKLPGITKNIALCMGINDLYEHGIARGVVKYAKQHADWKLYGYGWMFRPLDDLEYWRGHGIIARVESEQDADRMAALNLPVVDVAGAYTGAGFHQVNNDDFRTGALAGEYLLSCGFRNLAFCGVKGVGWSTSRLQGYHHSIRDTCSNVPCLEESLPWWEQLANSEHLREWLQDLTYPAGIFACNDAAGVKVTEVCRALSISVPEEAAIIGVDNEDILCELSSPSLTSIELDCQSIGYQAASLMNSIIEKGSDPERVPSPILVPPGQLIERESTQVFTSQDTIVQQAVRYIRAAATEGIKVGDVLQKVPASRRSLENRFKGEMKRTLHDEIIRVRMERAKILLKTSNLTVADIGSSCGFGTLQQFHAQFRRAVGTSPGEFRKGEDRKAGHG